ncbi:isoprenylcysteine carboxylmethyltransferase family protein [candidate division KSB1 bacterium]|nr:isoprenylcysteine carboxylmethyltransferase family protein [candidate division KSB1 bacterium]NIR71869.1 isoprenylcysteine carboxylmethyltransferase family protein [candidate division KSB1 bacterium]NIS26436.1 isoprenylcysteine carboxylmethyltransferase family protein [candidate division KSB1 bacterium]NIT73206.1 isoprenylcysteine carboxylmethyltransferase family protein [candidate division KSB1 bacterium]NIU27120.1 isoprenylcysteine carboxylmethyltransferase family protein [candidate divisi
MTKSNQFLTWIGITALVAFVAIYAVELFHHGGPPVTIVWIRDNFGKTGLIILNILIVVAFLALLPYRRTTISTWKQKGVFVAFVIALMTEMFGWPLLIFLISPLVEVPSVRGWAREIFGHYGAMIGTWLSMIGLLLIALGWRQIHKAEGLVTSGIYRYMRHPQYTGIFLFTLGWILHWPSVITLSMWPILVAAYVWLARREEKFAVEEFGDTYRRYADNTPRFFPRVWPVRSRSEV